MKTELGNKLRLLRNERNLSMEQVCSLFRNKGVSINKQSVSCYEKGEQSPTPVKLAVFMEVYKTDLNYLFDGAVSSLQEYTDYKIKHRRPKVRKVKKHKNLANFILDLTYPSCKHGGSKSVFKFYENDTNYTVRACKKCGKAYSVEILDL